MVLFKLSMQVDASISRLLAPKLDEVHFVGSYPT